jgi:hypothetical protein
MLRLYCYVILIVANATSNFIAIVGLQGGFTIALGYFNKALAFGAPHYFLATP